MSYTSSGDYCGASYSPPDSCGAAGTRTDKDENTPAVIWLLAAFPDTSSPEVAAIQFGIEHNLPTEQGYFAKSKMCADLEMPDAGWPETGFGNLVSFGSSAHTELLFAFYYFAAYGFEDAYFGTTVYPSAEEAKLVDDSEPPVEDLVTRFGTVRWYAAGSNDCPGVGGGEDDSPDDPGGEDVPGDPGDEDEAEEGLDGDGDNQWTRNCILACLRSDQPLPSREAAQGLGISSFDALGEQLGMTQVQRLLQMNDDWCSQYPVGGRLITIQFENGTDEVATARRFTQLPEVVWAQPDYVFPGEVFSNDTYYSTQWYLDPSNPTNCPRSLTLVECCDVCGIGLETAWEYSRGDSTVHVAFFDSGADVVHPDLINSWMVSPHRSNDPNEWEDRNGDGDADLCPWDPNHPNTSGDLDQEDNDGNGVVDDILLGWQIRNLLNTDWVHVALHLDPETYSSIHGSAVAGILGAMSENEKGIASAPGGTPSHPGVRLIQYSFYPGTGGVWSLSCQVQSFYDARSHKARVYSSSADFGLGAACYFPNGRWEFFETEAQCIAEGGTWTGVQDAVLELAPSMLFLQAAGNSGTTPMSSPFARLRGVMAVGGYSCEDGSRWHIPGPDYHHGGHQGFEWVGSDYGPELSVLGPTDDNKGLGSQYPRAVMGAPGVTDDAVCSPTGEDAWACFGGTSAATPIVASIAGLLLSYSDQEDLDLTPAQVRMILEHTAEDVQCDTAYVGCECDNPDYEWSDCRVRLLGWDKYSGYGRVDAARAFTLPVADLAPLGRNHYESILIVPHGATLHLSWEALDIDPENGDLEESPAHFELHYLASDYDLDWVPIDEDIDPTERSHDWVIPDYVPTGCERRIRLTVVDSGTVSEDPHRYEDYSERFCVIGVGSVADGEVGSVGYIGPNPFTRGIRIIGTLNQSSIVRAQVFDVGGRLVKMLSDGTRAAGPWSLEWDGTGGSGGRAATGIYFIRVTLGDRTHSVRLACIR